MMKKVLALLAILLPSVAHAQIVGTLPFQLQNGTTADATQVMADFNKILTDVNTNGAKNGVNTDITALNALVTPITPAQGGTTVYFASTSGGSANAQTVASPTPTGFTLAVGKRVTFIAGFTNSGPLTVAPGGGSGIPVLNDTSTGPVPLTGGEVVARALKEYGVEYIAGVPGHGIWALFDAFLARPGQLLSKSQLEEKLYGWNEEVESNAISVYMHQLRKKLGPAAISTHRGLGYRLEA